MLLDKLNVRQGSLLTPSTSAFDKSPSAQADVTVEIGRDPGGSGEVTGECPAEGTHTNAMSDTCPAAGIWAKCPLPHGIRAAILAVGRSTAAVDVSAPGGCVTRPGDGDGSGDYVRVPVVCCRSDDIVRIGSD